MKRVLLSLSLLVLSYGIFAQEISIPKYEPSAFSTYYWQRASHFQQLPIDEDAIVFLGDSITDGAEWSELFNRENIKNRGISGDTTDGVLNRLKTIVEGEPEKVFLLIGVNDLSRGKSADEIFMNILRIAMYIKQESPDTQLFIQSILPVNDQFGKFGSHVNKTSEINAINVKLKENAAAYQYEFIDLNSHFSNAEGKMDSKYTNDGLHLLGAGYALWSKLIRSYVLDEN